jgi:putative nucleotidyltransferase with HDIG domain
MSASSSSVNLREAVKYLERLPAMPEIAQKILMLNLESREGEQAMLKLIEKDPLISGRIIGLANTPLFGPSKRVTSVSDAAMLLGITRVKTVSVGIAVMSTLAAKSTGDLDIQGLWLHSLAISLAARTIARAMPGNARPLDDEIFLAGLLHDIGYLVLNHLDPQKSTRLHAQFVAEPERSSLDIERELLEMNHSELGAELARFWDLPQSIITVIRYHHDPQNAEASKALPLVSIINLAERILSFFGISEHDTYSISPENWQALGIAPAKGDELIELIKMQSEEAKQSAGNVP